MRTLKIRITPKIFEQIRKAFIDFEVVNISQTICIYDREGNEVIFEIVEPEK